MLDVVLLAVLLGSDTVVFRLDFLVRYGILLQVIRAQGIDQDAASCEFQLFLDFVGRGDILFFGFLYKDFSQNQLVFDVLS